MTTGYLRTSVYLGLDSREGKSPSQWGVTAASDRNGGRSRKAESSHPPKQAESRESKLDTSEATWSQNLSPVTSSLQQGRTSQTSPHSTTYWRPDVQTPEPAGDISRPSTKSSITCSQQSCVTFVLLIYLNRVIRFSQSRGEITKGSEEEEASVGEPF